MNIPAYIKETDRLAMNEAARDMAWKWRGIGIMISVDAIREGISGGYRPTHDELAALCNMLEDETRKPRVANMEI
jgi:hypothetical protein